MSASSYINNGASRLLKRRRLEAEGGDPLPGVTYGAPSASAGRPVSAGGTVIPEVSIRTWDDESIITGSNRPPIVSTERLQSTNLVVNSNQRVAGDPFTFTVDCGGSLLRGRMISLYRAILPKIPNVTALNNTLVIASAGGGGVPFVGVLTVTIPTGFYTTTDICNELVFLLNTAAGGADTYTCTFDTRSETFTLSSVGGNLLSVDATCSFQLRGTNFFQFINPSGGPTPSLVSTKAGMLYTRYVTVASVRVDRYSVAPTLLSAADIPTADIIAVIDTAKLYGPEDFDILTPFSGCFAEVDTPEAPFIRISNDSREFNTTGMDFTLLDEYGFPLQRAFGTTNTQGVVLMFEVYF
jgi:hypothetical protein